MVSHFTILSIALLLISLVSAQSSGQWTIEATDTSSPTTGCVVLSQLHELSSPNILTSMVPICPASAGLVASQPASGSTVAWPFTPSGDGAGSSLAIYAQISGSGTTATAGCVLHLNQMQVMYVLGRSLKWDNAVNQLYDNTAAGFLLDPTSFQPLTCGGSADLLPASLTFPNPYLFGRADPAWSMAITPGAQAPAVAPTEVVPTPTPSTVIEVVTSTQVVDPPTSPTQASTAVQVVTTIAVSDPPISNITTATPSTTAVTTTSISPTAVLVPDTTSSTSNFTSTDLPNTTSSPSPSTSVAISSSSSIATFSTTTSSTLATTPSTKSISTSTTTSSPSETTNSPLITHTKETSPSSKPATAILQPAITSSTSLTSTSKVVLDTTTSSSSLPLTTSTTSFTSTSTGGFLLSIFSSTTSPKAVTKASPTGRFPIIVNSSPSSPSSSSPTTTSPSTTSTTHTKPNTSTSTTTIPTTAATTAFVFNIDGTTIGQFPNPTTTGIRLNAVLTVDPNLPSNDISSPDGDHDDSFTRSREKSKSDRPKAGLKNLVDVSDEHSNNLGQLGMRLAIKEKLDLHVSMGITPHRHGSAHLDEPELSGNAVPTQIRDDSDENESDDTKSGKGRRGSKGPRRFAS